MNFRNPSLRMEARLKLAEEKNRELEAINAQLREQYAVLASFVERLKVPA